MGSQLAAGAAQGTQPWEGGATPSWGPAWITHEALRHCSVWGWACRAGGELRRAGSHVCSWWESWRHRGGSSVCSSASHWFNWNQVEGKTLLQGCSEQELLLMRSFFFLLHLVKALWYFPCLTWSIAKLWMEWWGKWDAGNPKPEVQNY